MTTTNTPAMKIKLLLSSYFAYIVTVTISAQEKSKIKFGKITPEDFKTKCL